MSIESLGASVSSILALPPFRGVHRSDGSVAGRVIHIDRFGNLVTSIRGTDVPKGEVTLEIAGVSIHGIGRTYGAGDEPVALIGSSGYLEIALPLGNAGKTLDAEPDTLVTLRPVVVRLKKTT